MATLRAALAAAPAARLVRGALLVVVAEDLDGECAISVQLGFGTPHPPKRFSTLTEVLAYLLGSAVPGVRGDEQDWVALSA